MLETALFGESSNAPNMQPVHSSSSSSLSARQLLREQQVNHLLAITIMISVFSSTLLLNTYLQNDEYLASLLADKEKEMNAVNEAATCQLKEDANKRIEPMVVLLNFVGYFIPVFLEYIIYLQLILDSTFPHVTEVVMFASNMYFLKEKTAIFLILSCALDFLAWSKNLLNIMLYG